MMKLRFRVSGGWRSIFRNQSPRNGRVGTALELLSQDVLFGLRQLWRTPGFAVSAVAALVLGIGANTAIFSPRGGKVVVLSYGLWQRRFGGDPSVAGKSISLGNEPYNVAGVIGKDFVAEPQSDLWLPFQFDPVSTDQNFFFEVTGLLRPGVTVAQANAALAAASPPP